MEKVSLFQCVWASEEKGAGARKAFGGGQAVLPGHPAAQAHGVMLGSLDDVFERIKPRHDPVPGRDLVKGRGRMDGRCVVLRKAQRGERNARHRRAGIACASVL